MSDGDVERFSAEVRRLERLAMPMWWNRAGRPLTDVLEWAALFEDDDYRVLAVDRLAFPSGHVQVSTVWLGMDALAGIRGGPPRIFETMVQGGRRWRDGYQHHYPTEALARMGHGVIVEAIRLDWSHGRLCEEEAVRLYGVLRP